MYAVQQSLQHIDFGDVLFFCDARFARDNPCPPPVSAVPIHPLGSIDDYSRFVLGTLAEYVRTSHVLIIQWDGFVTTPHLWRDVFLRYDYVGPPWYHNGHPGYVGNGGFSLRSRKLLNATIPLAANCQEPEDVCICVSHREELESRCGIQFAPLDVAVQFGCEYGPFKESFGFHGMHNFIHVMSAIELDHWLDEAPPAIINTIHTRKLIKELMQTGHYELALKLIKMRSQSLGWTKDQVILYIRTQAHRALKVR